MTMARNNIRLLLGGLLWITASLLLLVAGYTVYASGARPVVDVFIALPLEVSLRAGDSVYLRTETGLKRIGEVVRTTTDHKALAAIETDDFSRLNASTHAKCWQAPLSAEDALDALFPSDLQAKAARQIKEDWEAHDEELARTWGPIARELLAAYVASTSEDIELAVRRHEKELWSIARQHGIELTEIWPDVQERLRPILQEHLTPVLGRLMYEAIHDAPKVSLAWQVARGRNEEAFRGMLDWLAEYLADMPEADKDEMKQALRETWEKARSDPGLAALFEPVGENLLNDERLKTVLTTIYREAIADNPRTALFLRTQLLESPSIREPFYRFVELFAPTARKVAALCLFHDGGKIRPEVVHWVRSVALDREVAWITLETPNREAPPLSGGETLSSQGWRPVDE